MTRAERVALHTNQKRMQLSGNMPNEKSLVEGKPQYRETFKGLYQYVKYNNEVYSQLLTKNTRSLEEEINDTVNNITINDLTVTDPIDVDMGGTGLTTITDHSVLVGSGTGDITPIAVGGSGQILVGSAGADPVFATLTCDDGLSSTTGAGTLEIDLDLKSAGGLAIESNELALSLGDASITGTLAVGDGGTGQTTVTDFKNVLDDETWTFANNVTATGRVIVDDTTDATSTTDGSLQTDGGLSVVKSAVIGDDLDLLSDSCILNIGNTSKFTLTDQGANNCVMASSGHRLAFGDAGEYISGDGSDITITSSADILLSPTTYVGIGDTTPESLLHMKGANPVLTIQDTETSAGSADARIRLAESDGPGDVQTYWDIHNSGLNLLLTRSDGTGNVVIRSSYITDHAVNSKPASNGRHFATGHADYQQNYSWIGLYNQISDYDAGYGDWSP